jgi:hypothetical protein
LSRGGVLTRFTFPLSKIKFALKIMPINARNAGNGFERRLAIELRDIYPNIKTARYASRETDDSGIDFVNTGCVAIQAKRTKQRPNFKDVFAHMKTKLVKVIVWKNASIRGKSGEYAVIPLEDFKKLLMDLEG